MPLIEVLVGALCMCIGVMLGSWIVWRCKTGSSENLFFPTRKPKTEMEPEPQRPLEDMTLDEQMVAFRNAQLGLPQENMYEDQ